MSFSPPVGTFLLSIVFGLVIGIFWDILKIIQKNIKYQNKKVIFITDIIFSIFIGIFTLIFFFTYTYSGFRFFVIIGEFLGFLLYYNAISKFILKLLKPIIETILKIFITILNVIKKFVNIIIKIITPMFNKITKTFTKSTCFYSKNKCIMRKLLKFKKK